jgi:hypothetical protein
MKDIYASGFNPCPLIVLMNTEYYFNSVKNLYDCSEINILVAGVR